METDLLNKLFLLISIRKSRTLRESNWTAISQFAYKNFLYVFIYFKMGTEFLSRNKAAAGVVDHPLTTYRRGRVWVDQCLSLSSISAWNVT
jgi:hypothetical protein